MHTGLLFQIYFKMIDIKIELFLPLDLHLTAGLKNATGINEIILPVCS
jgi:hypothetical protein